LSNLLDTGNILTVSELLLAPPADIAKKCKLTHLDLQTIVHSICQEYASQPKLLEDVKHEGNQTFTSGSVGLDNALCGGIRVGMVWEVVGERYENLFASGHHLAQLRLEVPLGKRNLLFSCPCVYNFLQSWVEYLAQRVI
jgi:hypothetical protein